MKKIWVVSGTVVLLLLAAVIFRFPWEYANSSKVDHSGESPAVMSNGALYSGLSHDMYCYYERIKKGEMKPVPSEITENDVYTFLQGPKSWESGIDWSGAWCREYLAGNYFGSFGCGMCCMANIYDTLADDKGSPLDAYDFAIEESAYAPSPQAGAIGWGDLKNCLRKMGMVCDLYHKPKQYKDFQEQMAECKSMIVLVSSYEDDTFWKDTSGHYVNIWLYDREADEVFLADPGSPFDNRSWIPLKYVYDALKLVSEYQYIKVDEYVSEGDIWHPDGIYENWNKPEHVDEGHR